MLKVRPKMKFAWRTPEEKVADALMYQTVPLEVSRTEAGVRIPMAVCFQCRQRIYFGSIIEKAKILYKYRCTCGAWFILGPEKKANE